MPECNLNGIRVGFGSPGQDLTHQPCRAVESNSSPVADRVLTLATRAFPQFPDVHGQVIPWLCYEAEDKDAGMYDIQPKTVEGALDCMQFYQNSRRCRPQLPRH